MAFVAEKKPHPAAEPQATEDGRFADRECDENDGRNTDDVGAAQRQILTAMCFHFPWWKRATERVQRVK